MKKRLMLAGLIITVATVAVVWAQRETKEIGTFKSKYGTITFTIVKDKQKHYGQKPYAQIFVADEYVVDTVMFLMSKNELIKLRDQIDATIEELP